MGRANQGIRPSAGSLLGVTTLLSSLVGSLTSLVVEPLYWETGRWATEWETGRWAASEWNTGRWATGRWATGRWATGRWATGRWAEAPVY